MSTGQRTPVLLLQSDGLFRDSSLVALSKNGQIPASQVDLHLTPNGLGATITIPPGSIEIKIDTAQRRRMREAKP